MEVFYVRDDGTRVRGYAHLSYRKCVLGQWYVGDAPLDSVVQITHGQWVLGGDGPEWVQSAMAMIR